MSVSFKGGIHPHYGKDLAASAAIEELPPPQQVIVHLDQHIGAPAKALVKKKEEVKKGQPLGEPAGFVSVPCHAPISGKVKDVGLYKHPFGHLAEAIVIDSDGEDEWCELPDQRDPASMSADEIKAAIKDAGVVGMGGAAFPTHVKLSPPPNRKIDTVLLNGAECEPYLTADDRMMQEQPERVVSGFKAIISALGASEGVIGIEENKPDAIRSMESAVGSARGLRVARLHVKYPQGGEKQLIDATLKRQVPSGRLPMDVGVVVQNVATCVAVDDAVRFGKPLIERVTTVTGEAINRPCNLRIRIGTSVAEFIEAAGGLKANVGRVILGGPMMGLAAHSIETPSIKATGGILCLTQEQLAPADWDSCIRCGRCVRACPMHLTPNELGNFAEVEMWQDVVDTDVKDCIECGCCAFSCPANRPLVQWIRYAKLWDRQQEAARKAAEEAAKKSDDE